MAPISFCHFYSSGSTGYPVVPFPFSKATNLPLQPKTITASSSMQTMLFLVCAILGLVLYTPKMLERTKGYNLFANKNKWTRANRFLWPRTWPDSQKFPEQKRFRWSGSMYTSQVLYVHCREFCSGRERLPVAIAKHPPLERIKILLDLINTNWLAGDLEIDLSLIALFVIRSTSGFLWHFWRTCSQVVSNTSAILLCFPS